MASPQRFVEANAVLALDLHQRPNARPDIRTRPRTWDIPERTECLLLGCDLGRGGVELGRRRNARCAHRSGV
jgi:hypothetical protein